MSGVAGVPHYRIQYKMMDDNGLLAQQNIDWLTRNLSPTEQSMAERVLRLAAKCRNAVAHGAIVRYTDDLRGTYSHVVVKAMQLVIEG